MTALMAVLVVGLVLVGAWFQWGTNNWLGEKTLAGDEGEYLKRGRAADPFGPEPFIRVPLMALIALGCQLFPKPVMVFRLVMQVASLMSVILTALCGWCLGGFWVGVLAGSLLLIHPERLVLSGHLWPDPLLALWISAINLILVAHFFPLEWAVLWIGVFIALAVMTRIEAVVLLIGVAAWIIAIASYPQSAILLCAAILPSLFFLLAYAGRNKWKYGIFLPDTTFLFNLALLKRSLEGDVRLESDLDSAISHHKLEWDNETNHHKSRHFQTALWTAIRRPIAVIIGFLGRFWMYVGPDTFIRQKLFSAEKGTYPALTHEKTKLAKATLFFFFPLLFTSALIGSFLSREFPAFLIWPSLAMGVAGCLVHTRTRFRMVILPILCLAVALGFEGLCDNGLDRRGILVCGLGMLWFILTLTLPRTEEVAGGADDATSPSGHGVRE